MAEKYPFWYGGFGGCTAAFATHPLDLAKARLQTATKPGQGLVSMLVTLVRTEGVLSIYDGLSASLLRQATYSTTRFGVYEGLKSWAAGHSKETPPIHHLLPISMFSGLCGSLVGNPADMINVRMQNDRARPAELRRNYKNAVDGLIRAVREEGPAVLARGAGANAVRGVLMTASQVVSYDKAKQFLVNQGMDPCAHSTFFTASMFAGFVATTVCSPADVIKTLAMNSSEKLSAKVIQDQIKKEGALFLFRGWTPAFVRLGPQTIVTFVVMEWLRNNRVGMSS